MILETMRAAIARHTGPEVARAAVKSIQDALGGQRVYIPAKDTAARNADIKAAFNGRNHAEICARYDIGLATLYRVLGGGQHRGPDD